MLFSSPTGPTTFLLDSAKRIYLNGCFFLNAFPKTRKSWKVSLAAICSAPVRHIIFPEKVSCAVCRFVHLRMEQISTAWCIDASIQEVVIPLCIIYRSFLTISLIGNGTRHIAMCYLQMLNIFGTCSPGNFYYWKPSSMST